MPDSILTDRCRARLASHTPAETLASLRAQLLAEQLRTARVLAERLHGHASHDMTDVATAFAADTTYNPPEHH